ncbi:hypothetical protein [Luteibacter aegosomatissinici]|uniref:hypothetical protein n=1 Tax=Luteibacter aegosomatissinici TaxID=2911539 RepID=UPI001FF7E07A|nr:hypothetical protein [Luteibacter aegosomatissinici]UPG92712.1 hypothetical protein L2Y97_12635 [Luteibacter aegosomatissinici]
MGNKVNLHAVVSRPARSVEDVSMDILCLASSLESCPVMRVRWYFEGCLACVGGLTAHQLVEAGRGQEVMDFLRRALFDEQRHWDAAESA